MKDFLTLNDIFYRDAWVVTLLCATFIKMLLVTTLDFYHMTLIYNYYTTYIKVKFSDMLEIYGNPFTRGSLLLNLYKIFCKSSLKRVDFVEKVREEVFQTEKVVTTISPHKNLKRNTSGLDETNFEHINSKINLVLQNRNKDTEITNNKSTIQIKVENIDLLQSNEHLSFRNEISIPSLSKLSRDNMSRSKSCRIKVEFTIRNSKKKHSLMSATNYCKGTTL